MKRIEQLLNIPVNKKRYPYLLEAVRKNKLVVFFGAGLSLWNDYRKWEYPFVWTNRQLEKQVDVLKEYFKDYDNSEISEQLADIETLLSVGKQQRETGKFLEWGETLSKAIENINALHFKTPLGKDTCFSSFNDACVKSFKAKKKVPDFEVPYNIPAIYYLPYLSSLLITTNVDSSFSKICEKTGKFDWGQLAVTPITKYDKKKKWELPAHFVLYIHGHINNPESLVMTAKEYKRMYPKSVNSYRGHRGARMVLKSVVKDYSILFIGAGLQDDTTVKIFNYEAEQEENIESRKKHHLRFIPVVGIKSDGELDKPPKIKECEVFVFSEGMFQEIPSLLLHLIRDTAPQVMHNCCTWRKPALDDVGFVSDESKLLLFNSLNSLSTFEEIELNEEDSHKPYDVINYLFDHYSIAKHDDGLGWSICCVDKNTFSLDGEPIVKDKCFSPIHNYPIGDTIYILKVNRLLTADESETIAHDIKAWYDKKGFTPVQPVGESPVDGDITPRIRIIVLSDYEGKELSGEEYERRFNEYHAFLGKLDDLGIELTVSIIQEAEKYFMMNIASPTIKSLISRVKEAENAKIMITEDVSQFDNSNEHSSTLSLKNES